MISRRGALCGEGRLWLRGALVVALVLTLQGGCQAPARAPEAAPPELLLGQQAAHGQRRPSLPPEQGRRLYTTLCQSCHGPAGRGDTSLARSLNPSPADLSLCNFKYRSTPSGSLPQDDDLRRTLHVGLPGSAMPSFGALLPWPALDALVLQIKARCRRFDLEPPDPPLPAPGRAYYNEASVTRGARIYRREGCHACHGDGGGGDGPAATTLKDNRGQALRPRDHTRGVFRSGFRRVDIYRAFSTGLDGTPMPALPEAVTAQDRWDLTHYLVSLSQRRNKIGRALGQAPTWYEPIRAWGLPWR